MPLSVLPRLALASPGGAQPTHQCLDLNRLERRIFERVVGHFRIVRGILLTGVDHTEKLARVGVVEICGIVSSIEYRTFRVLDFVGVVGCGR